MYLKNLLSIVIISLLFLSCSGEKHEKKQTQKRDIPNKITILFVTQPHCPSCDTLEETMKQKKPLELINKYFKIKKINIGEKLPEGLIPPNGTPTVYFLGYKNEALVEPMIGEKSEEKLMMFLNDALYEFKNLYGINLRKRKDNNETNNSNNNN